MLIDVSQIIKENRALLRHQSEVCLNHCLSLENEPEIVIDLQNLEAMTSGWINFLLVGLEDCGILNKIKIVNVKEDVWQLKIDEAYKLATNKVYRQHVEEILHNFFEGLEDDNC